MNFNLHNLFRYSLIAQSVEHAAVNRSVVGSSPTQGVLAQWLSWLERRPVTAEVVGSSPIWVALLRQLLYAVVAELADARDLKSRG